MLLCYTSALAAALRSDGFADTWTVRELAADLLDLSGADDPAPRTSWTAETWDRIPERASEASIVGPARNRVDAVIVDEAQDLAGVDWTFVRALAADRPLWAFMDDGQAFWSDRPMPRDLFPASFKLTARYRCPEPLARFADQYREGAEARDAETIAELNDHAASRTSRSSKPRSPPR